MSLVSFLYKVARVANNINAISNPKRIGRRAKNIVKGRLLGRIGFWK